MTNSTGSESLPKTLTTLCLLRKENEVLLAMKKRGFGAGKWNGVGGKVQANETIEQAALRETSEEIGVIPKALQQVATLHFNFATNPALNNQVTVYIVEEWEGEPQESEEMAPQWFTVENIPYDAMWQADALWMPKVLVGTSLTATFVYDANKALIDSSIEALAQ